MLLLYRDLSEDIYLMDHSTFFHTINNCKKYKHLFSMNKGKNKIKCVATNC